MKHTTVILTKVAQEIKEDLAPIFGLKNILSAGLLLFGKLSDTDQKKIIAEANSISFIEAKKAAREDEAAAAQILKTKRHKKKSI